MKQTNRNQPYFIIAMGLRTVALLCVTGPIMQTFLASIGFSSQWIYIHTSIVQIVNVLTISLCSTWADHGNVIKRTAFVELPYALLYLLYIPFCLWKSPSVLSFCMLTGICLLQSVCIALWTICEYKLPYYIFTPKEYGSMLSVGGIVGGLISLGAGMVISRLSGLLSYASLMLCACVVSMVLMLICVALHLGLKPVGSAPTANPKASSKKTSQLEIFRYPVFRRMIPANLMRGFGYGTTTIFAAIALDLGFDAGVATALVSAQSIASLAGCALFGISIAYLPPRCITLAGSLTFALIPLMLIPNKYVSDCFCTGLSGPHIRGLLRALHSPGRHPGSAGRTLQRMADAAAQCRYLDRHHHCRLHPRDLAADSDGGIPAIFRSTLFSLERSPNRSAVQIACFAPKKLPLSRELSF